MSDEQAVQGELIAKFPYLEGKVRVARVRRIFADVPPEKFAEVFEYATKQAGFSILCTITGLDEGATLGALYHLARENGVMLNLKISVPKEKPVIRTVTGQFPSADCYEREMEDLLGMQVEGLAAGSRYPLPDGWPAGEYPLRKEWKAERLDGPAEKKGDASHE